MEPKKESVSQNKNAIFKNCCIHILPAGLGKKRLTLFETQIRNHGGECILKLSERACNITHVVVEDSLVKDTNRCMNFLRGMAVVLTTVKVVGTQWLSKCLKEGRQVETEEFEMCPSSTYSASMKDSVTLKEDESLKTSKDTVENSSDYVVKYSPPKKMKPEVVEVKKSPYLTLKRKCANPANETEANSTGPMKKGVVSAHEIHACGALLCENRTKSKSRNKKLVLHRFPRDVETCKEWLRRAGRLDLKEKSVKSIRSNMALCENHFEKNCFYRLHRLRRNAMPTVFQHSENSIPDVDAATQQFDHMYCINAKEVGFKTINVNDVSDSKMKRGNPKRKDVLHKRAQDGENDSGKLNTLHEDLSVCDEMVDFGDITEFPWDKMPSQICRLCACTNELHPKQSINGWLSLLNEIIPDLVHLNDGLPQHICRPCAKQLYACAKVKSGFIEADKKLKETVGLAKPTNCNTEANSNNSGIQAQTDLQEDGNDSTSSPPLSDGEESEADKADACSGTQYNKVKSEFAEAYEKLQLALGFVKSKSHNIEAANRNSEVAAEIDGESNSIAYPLLNISEQTGDETSKSNNIETVNENSVAAKVEGGSNSVYYNAFYNSEQVGDFNKEESKEYETETVNGNSEVVISAQAEDENKFTYYPTFDNSEQTDDLKNEESNKHNIETANRNSEVIVAAQVESVSSSICYPTVDGSKSNDFNIKGSNGYVIETVNGDSEVTIAAELEGGSNSLGYPVFDNSDQTDDFNNKESTEENTDIWTNMECVIDENNCMTFNNFVFNNTQSSVVVINRKNFKLHYPPPQTRQYLRELKYPCSECKEMFTNKKKLKVHMRLHTAAPKGPEKLTCKLCGMSFSLKYKLILHVNSHARQQSLICEYCGDAFQTVGGFENHQLRHFPPNYSCSECDKSFYTKTSLNVHKKTHLKDEKLICHVCGQLLCNRVTLKLHLQSHLGEKPYQCTICGKCYTSSSILKEHTCIHTANSLTCDLCGKGFKRRRTLRNHIHNHVKPKMHKCPICIMAFRSNADKLKHVKLCSRNITCVVCRRLFRTIERMEEHRTNEHSADEVIEAAEIYRVMLRSRRRKCKFCQQIIIGKHNMLKHIRYFHKVL